MVASRLLSYKFAALVTCTVLVQALLLKANPINSECSSCTSKACISHANRIIRSLKPSVEPCEDFFSFACGDYLEKFGIDDTHSMYDDTWNSLQNIIRDLIENLRPSEGTASGKLKTVYESCIRKDSSEIRAVPDALDFLNQIGIPDWPNADPNFQFTDLNETLGRLAVHGEFAFITIKPTPYEESGVNANGLPPAIILPGNYLSNGKMKPKDVQGAVFRILSYFNVAQNESEKIWENFKTIEDIGIQLQNEESRAALGCEGISRKTHAVINCSGEIHDAMKNLCNFWNAAVENGNLKNYFSVETIHVSCRWNHFYYIENVFLNLIKANHRSLADYLTLRFFINHLDDMNLYFHLTKKTYPGDLPTASKTSEPIRRWEYCIGWIIKSMNLALGYEYTKEILTPPIVKNALDMIENYFQTLDYKIRTVSWIDNRVKWYLKKMLDNTEIGFKTTMETFRNQTAVSDYYKEYHPVKESFLKNILEYGKMSIIKKDNMAFNSFYSSSDPYVMDFGAAVFLPPTYSHGLPKIWNYASLGAVIGHELSHNLKYFFDVVNLDDETQTSLNSKLQCYVQQFSQFVMERTGNAVIPIYLIISNESKEEIFADNIGWELTEKVLEHVVDISDKLTLPGLGYNPLQLMYISFAQDSCATYSKEVEKEFYATKPHSLAKLRVLSILQNSRIFSGAFNCSTTKTTNPENKCVFFD